MRICGGAQLLSCSHLVDYTSIPLIFQVNLIGRRSFLGIKYGTFLCISSFNCYDEKIQKVAHAHFFPQNSSSPMFQDPTKKSHLTLILIHDNPTIVLPL